VREREREREREKKAASKQFISDMQAALINLKPKNNKALFL
jgi:hypothetical protein